MPFVPIIMGSLSDIETGRAVASRLGDFSIDCEIRVASAHKAPSFLLGLLQSYEADPRTKVYVTIAGRSNALSALVDAQVTAPVIACPPYSSKFGGGDIFSSLRMPSGVAPVVVLDPKGAALAAAKVFSLSHPEIRAQIQAAHQAMEEKVRSSDQTLRPGGEAAS